MPSCQIKHNSKNTEVPSAITKADKYNALSDFHFLPPFQGREVKKKTKGVEGGLLTLIVFYVLETGRLEVTNGNIEQDSRWFSCKILK